MGKTLLLISNKEEDKAFAAEVAVTAGLTLQTAQSPQEGAELIGSNQASLVFVDATTEQLYAELEQAIQNTVGLFSESVNNNNFHFISDQGPEKSAYIVNSPLFGNLLLRNFGRIQDTGQHYGRIIKASLGDRIFGLQQLMSPTAKVQSVKLAMSTQKQDAVDAVKNYLTAAQFQSRMASLIANAVDELLMNAIFDAPVDELGRPLYSKLDRAAPVKLDGRASVEMQVGYDGQYLGISVIDQWGSIDKPRLIQHMSKLYHTAEYKLRNTQAGAGIGLASVFHTGGSFIFASESRVRTEATVFYRRTDNFKTFRDQFRFLVTQFYF